jgi:hypothetical protein
MRRLLARCVRPICFGMVSWIGQNGFVDRLDRLRRPVRSHGRFGLNCGPARNRAREKNNNENNGNDPQGVLGVASGARACCLLGRPASAAAEFEFKLGVNAPETHPLTIRLAAIPRCCRRSAPAASSYWRRLCRRDYLLSNRARDLPLS